MEIQVKDDNFQKEVIEQSKKIPIMVDFWAQWCMPCLTLSPVLDKLAKEYKNKFILAKINVDEGRETSTKYGIRSIPCVKLFKDGKIVDEFVGAIPEEMIKEFLHKNLK